MFYVYEHIRNDTNAIFYVGKGKNNRAYTKRDRNEYWHNIVNKCGMYSEIIEDNISWEMACELEKFWIKHYGRKNNNTGILVNMTDGGEGTLGNIMSIETKDKIRQKSLGRKLSKEHKLKISESHKGKPKPKPKDFSEKMRNIVKGSVRSEESKLKQSITTKKTLSKIKDKLIEKSKGEKNSNSVQYSFFNNLTNEIVLINGYKSVLDYYNNITNQNKKDAMFLITKIRNNKIPELTFLNSKKLNKKPT